MQILSRLGLFAVIGVVLAACSIKKVDYTGLDGGIGGPGDDAGTLADAFVAPPVSITGTVTGLTGSGLVLANGGETLTVAADGTFTFPTRIAGSYDVTVTTQPSMPTQHCTVANGSGVTGNADVNNIAVTCDVVGFTVGGTIEGLAGTGLMLLNSGGDALAVTANGTFTFATPVPSGRHYGIEVAAQPGMPTQACLVTGASGDVADANVTSIAITCQTRSFSIGGTVTGLAGTGLVLRDNGGDDLPITGNGAFTFTTPVLSGTTYSVTVATQPSGPLQTCAVSGGTGTVGGSDVTSVTVNCSTLTFTISGSVSGLAGTGLVLQDNGGDDLAISGNGTFAFSTAIASGATYRVTVKTPPTGPSQTCTVVNSTGTVSGSNITNVVVTCTTSTFSIGGTVTGLATNDRITLRDNGGDDLPITGNGGFTFATRIPSGQSYAVTSDSPTSPIAQSCVVTNASGMVGAANVTNVVVTCTKKTFTIGGTVTGLSGTGLVLQANGTDDLAISANGAFTFSQAIASGTGYNVTVKASPTGAQCTPTASTGTVGAANVTSVVITCAKAWSTSLFPITLPAGNIGAADIAFDGNGDLLVGGYSTRAVYRVSRTTGAVTTVATGFPSGDGVLGVAYRAATNTIYASTTDTVYTISASGTVTPLSQPGLGYVNGCAFAPPSFGAFGGFLICITSANVAAINPDTGAAVMFASSGAAPISDLAFAPDGTLYVSGNSLVATVAPNGTVTPLVTNLSSADGITVSPDGQRLFIADSGRRAVIQIALPGLAQTTLASNVAINGGYAVGGLVAAPGGTLIVLTDPGVLVGFGY